MGWLFYAIGSAIFAAATAVLAKIGVKDVDSNLATAIRTVIIVVFAWGIVFLTGAQKGISQISRFSLLFLILSGIVTGLSWFFYFRALQLGKASQVAPIDKFSLVLTIIFAAIFLSEKVSWPIGVGVLLITIGTLFIAFAK